MTVLDPASRPLPGSLVLERPADAVAVLRLSRPHKRNALDDATVAALGDFFADPPPWVRAVVLDAEGDHFCAGLDLSEMGEKDALAGLAHSRSWHRAFDHLERGRVPIVSVLRGAVIGGGLELATATHVRVAEPTTFYALPEGQRGLFVGGGASVRVPRLIGVHRMTDMMLTGRVHDAESGQQLGLSQYLVEEGEGLATAIGLAEKMADLAPVTTYAVLQVLPRIAEAGPDEGLLMESLMAAIASSSDDAKQRMSAFLSGRAGKIQR